DALDGVAEVECRLGLDIGAAARTRTGARCRSAGAVEQAAEEVAESTVAGATAEQVADVEGRSGATGESAGAGTEAALHAAGGEHAAGLVVFLALGGIRQDGVGLADGLETFFGLGVTGVGVGMQVPRQFPVGLLDLVLRCVGGDAQVLVEVLLDPLPLAHRASPPLAFSCPYSVPGSADGASPGVSAGSPSVTVAIACRRMRSPKR